MNNLPKIYHCKKCDRYTDVRYISDKEGGRYKSYCYKCGNEDLEPVEIKEDTSYKLDLNEMSMEDLIR